LTTGQLICKNDKAGGWNVAGSRGLDVAQSLGFLLTTIEHSPSGYAETGPFSFWVIPGINTLWISGGGSFHASAEPHQAPTGCFWVPTGDLDQWDAKQEEDLVFLSASSGVSLAVKSLTNPLSIWRVHLPQGFVRLGDFAHASVQRPNFAPTSHRSRAAEQPCPCGKPCGRLLIVRDHPALLRPKGYRLSWSDGEIYLWQPIPTPDYVALGCVLTHSSGPPSVDLVRCVHQSYTYSCRAHQIWNEHGVGNRVSLWLVPGLCTFASNETHCHPFELKSLNSQRGEAAEDPLKEECIEHFKECCVRLNYLKFEAGDSHFNFTRVASLLWPMYMFSKYLNATKADAIPVHVGEQKESPFAVLEMIERKKLRPLQRY